MQGFRSFRRPRFRVSCQQTTANRQAIRLLLSLVTASLALFGGGFLFSGWFFLCCCFFRCCFFGWTFDCAIHCWCRDLCRLHLEPARKLIHQNSGSVFVQLSYFALLPVAANRAPSGSVEILTATRSDRILNENTLHSLDPRLTKCRDNNAFDIVCGTAAFIHVDKQNVGRPKLTAGVFA